MDIGYRFGLPSIGHVRAHQQAYKLNSGGSTYEMAYWLRKKPRTFGGEFELVNLCGSNPDKGILIKDSSDSWRNFRIITISDLEYEYCPLNLYTGLPCVWPKKQGKQLPSFKDLPDRTW